MANQKLDFEVLIEIRSSTTAQQINSIVLVDSNETKFAYLLNLSFKIARQYQRHWPQSSIIVRQNTQTIFIQRSSTGNSRWMPQLMKVQSSGVCFSNEKIAKTQDRILIRIHLTDVHKKLSFERNLVLWYRSEKSNMRHIPVASESQRQSRMRKGRAVNTVSVPFSVFILFLIDIFFWFFLNLRKICSKLNKQQKQKQNPRFFLRSVISNAKICIYFAYFSRYEGVGGQDANEERHKKYNAHLMLAPSRCQIRTNIPHKHSRTDPNHFLIEPVIRVTRRSIWLLIWWEGILFYRPLNRLKYSLFLHQSNDRRVKIAD